MNQQEEIKSCTDCIHYNICALWTTTDLDKDEAYKYCFGHYKSKLENIIISKEEYHELKQAKTLLEFREETIKHLEDANIRYADALENKNKEIVDKISHKIHQLFNRDIKDSAVYSQEEKDLLKEFIDEIDAICKQTLEEER